MSLTLNDIKHPGIKAWVEECVAMCEPDNVVVTDGLPNTLRLEATQLPFPFRSI